MNGSSTALAAAEDEAALVGVATLVVGETDALPVAVPDPDDPPEPPDDPDELVLAVGLAEDDEVGLADGDEVGLADGDELGLAEGCELVDGWPPPPGLPPPPPPPCGALALSACAAVNDTACTTGTVHTKAPPTTAPRLSACRRDKAPIAP